MNYTVVVLGGVFILSLAWYYFPKYGGLHWFIGPVANIRPTDIYPGTDSDISGGPKEKSADTIVHEVPQV